MLSDEDVAGVAAIGSFGMVNAQLWYITTEDTIDNLIYAQVDGKVAGFKLKGQFIQTGLKDVAPGVEDSGSFYGLAAGYSMDNISINAGYYKNDEDQPVHMLSADSGVIFPGWRLGYVVANAADAEAMYADIGMGFGKVGVKIGYATASYDVGTINDTEVDEIWGQVSYKIAKNFNTYAKYSDQNADINAVDQKYFRFEAKYSF